MDAQNILVCGIGGQGVVLAGKIISNAAYGKGFDVKTSEVHGMSQRGGSVSTHIRFGEKVFSPLIPGQSADIILSFDIYETLRYARDFADKKTLIISSNYGKIPLWASARENDGISIAEITGTLKINFDKLLTVNKKETAMALGNVRVANIILLGLLSKFTDIEEDFWLKAIQDSVPEKTKEINIKAFLIGRNEK
ncbi:MAG: indolepyruvate oxidoreductase subunit beta [Deltaproteobacteria bacterium]|jgi:indolepyruvate ferredoxin oxidoreductase beta subunit|nr:indolepyruvate oxidoreductase subunit beta [Deltaproteobacteria bacterium]MCL5880413.1 indolepyruvate oxidoreductase subunit beta [Deltaproteobacteria bacterium]MDA8303659.1 indolepyruvate oxidoreductase subunit beta [Deltaproteobacteria bacterium]